MFFNLSDLYFWSGLISQFSHLSNGNNNSNYPEVGNQETIDIFSLEFILLCDPSALEQCDVVSLSTCVILCDFSWVDIKKCLCTSDQALRTDKGNNSTESSFVNQWILCNRSLGYSKTVMSPKIPPQSMEDDFWKLHPWGPLCNLQAAAPEDLLPPASVYCSFNPRKGLANLLHFLSVMSLSLLSRKECFSLEKKDTHRL